MSQIEDEFREKLTQHEGIPFDDSYWSKMEVLIEQDKRKRRVVFAWWTFGSILLIGLFLGYFAFEKQTPKLSDSQAQPSKSEIVEKQEIEYFEKSNTSKPEPEEIEKEEVLITKTSESKKIAEPKADVLTKPIEQSNFNTPVSSIENPIKEVETQETETLLTENFTNLPSQPFQTEILLTKKPIDFPPRLYLLSNIYFKPLQYISPIARIDSVKQSNKWSYFIVADYNFNIYTRKSSSSKLKDNEVTLNRFGFDVSFSARKKNWGFKTGLGIFNLVESTNYISEKTRTEYDTTFRMINPTYDEKPSGTKVALIKREINSTHYTDYSVDCPACLLELTYLKVPLLASYSVSYKRLNAFVEAGFNTSILIRGKGNYTMYEDNQFVVRNVNESKDLNRILLQTYSGIGYRYQAYKNFYLKSAYGFSQSIHSMTKSYNQRPTIHHLSFGIEMQL